MNGYCAQLGNIMDRRRAESALNAAKTSAELARASAVEAMVAAQTANRTKSEFLANISHELRTPLNAIIGFSQVMGDEVLGPIGTPRYREYAHDIRASAQRLSNIINDILDLSQIEAGKMRLLEDWVTAEKLIKQSIELVTEDAKSMGLTITADTSQSAALFVDETKMKQVLFRLLSNAVKFSRPGGKVTVQASALHDGRYQIKIGDTGIGIASKDLEHVFEPFVQIDSALDRKYEGTGLGLSLTRRLVELHGGTIALESTLDVGTTAILELSGDRVGNPKDVFSRDMRGESSDRIKSGYGAGL